MRTALHDGRPPGTACCAWHATEETSKPCSAECRPGARARSCARTCASACTSRGLLRSPSRARRTPCVCSPPAPAAARRGDGGRTRALAFLVTCRTRGYRVFTCVTASARELSGAAAHERRVSGTARSAGRSCAAHLSAVTDTLHQAGQTCMRSRPQQSLGVHLLGVHLQGVHRPFTCPRPGAPGRRHARQRGVQPLALRVHGRGGVARGRGRHHICPHVPPAPRGPGRRALATLHGIHRLIRFESDEPKSAQDQRANTALCCIGVRVSSNHAWGPLAAPAGSGGAVGCGDSLWGRKQHACRAAPVKHGHGSLHCAAQAASGRRRPRRRARA